MGGIRIEGSSGNVADATSAGNLKVQLPTAVSQMGGVRMFSENDDGSITGTANVKSPETSGDYRLRVGIDQVLDSQDWAVFSTSYPRKYRHYASGGGNISMSAQGLQWGNMSNANSHGLYGVRKFNNLGNSSALFFEQSLRITAALQSGSTLEFGISGRRSNTAQNGIYFQVTTSGIVGVVGSAVTSVMLVPSVNVTYNCSFAVYDKEVAFWINDIAYVLPVSATSTVGNASNYGLAYTVWYTQGSTAGGFPTGYLGGYSISLLDVHPCYDPKLNALLNGSGLYPPSGHNISSGAPLTIYQAGAQPAAVTLTANTAPATNALGGLFTLPASITPGNSDYPLFQYQVHDYNITNNSTAPKALVVTGVRIGELYVSSAITGGPLVLQWAVGYGGGSAASLSGMNATENSDYATPSHTVFPLGCQSVAATAAAGTVVPGFDMSFDAAPLVTHPGFYFTIILRVPAGTAMTAGTICGSVTVRGYYSY